MAIGNKRRKAFLYADAHKHKERVMKYRVRAWGHPYLPDLDFETDTDPTKQLEFYPCREVALLTPISRQAILDGLSELEKE